MVRCGFGKGTGWEAARTHLVVWAMWPQRMCRARHHGAERAAASRLLTARVCVCMHGHLTHTQVYMLNGLGISHGVDLNVLLDASEMICGAMGGQNASRATKALLAARTAARAAPA